MFDFEQIMKGYSKEDEFIARDIVILDLLIAKGIITIEEIEEAQKKIPTIIKDVHQNRINEAEKRLKELKESK